jgi:hypothetical protein
VWEYMSAVGYETELSIYHFRVTYGERTVEKMIFSLASSYHAHHHIMRILRDIGQKNFVINKLSNKMK